MQIKSVDQATVAAMAVKPSAARACRENAAPVKEENLRETKPSVTTATETETPVVDQVENDEGTPGVLRLLQEGHFKGVADVRLRINFADEIAAMEKEQSVPVVSDGINGLSEVVTGGMEPFNAENGLDGQAVTGIGEASATLTASLDQIAGKYQSGGITTTADVIAQIQSAFDGFASSVQSILDAASASEPEVPQETITPATGEVSLSMAMASVGIDTATAIEVAPVEETPAEETPADVAPSFNFQAALADLTAAFTAKLQELETALNSIQVLPPLSEPIGNGKAYDKFLAIYNTMHTTPEPQQQSNLPAVDAMA